MRTTNEVIEAARLGEPCTEEELRLAIVSMRTTLLLIHTDLARWTLKPPSALRVQLKAQGHFESIQTGWNIPLDQRVEPHNRPGHPEVLQRKRVAEAVVAKALEETDEDQGS